MTSFFAVASSILYRFIFPIIALHPVQHCSTLSSTPSRPFHPTLQDCTKESHPSVHTSADFSVSAEYYSSNFCFHPPYPKLLDWIVVLSSWFSVVYLSSMAQCATPCDRGSVTGMAQCATPVWERECDQHGPMRNPMWQRECKGKR